MTAAVYRSGTPSLNVPESQNTAPVLEFNCLYTHDIRRKQKRWQDGFLRFHTFNKRVMVYDVPRNFIGDAHWKAEEPLQDGDEVTLEKGGVIVQVAENVGRTETDLTELRQCKNKKSSEGGSSSPARPPRPTAPGGSFVRPIGLKHRSLNALLGTPRGPIGKVALPSKSPFEVRQASVIQRDNQENRPTKRQRVDPSPASNVVRTAIAIAASPENETTLRTRTPDLNTKKRKAAAQLGQSTFATKEVIDLCDNAEETRDKFLPGFSSDALAPSSPLLVERPVRDAPLKQTPVRSSSPAFQTQKVSANGLELVPLRAVHTTQQREAQGAIDGCEQTRDIRRSRRETTGGAEHASDSRHNERPRMFESVSSRKNEATAGRTLKVAASGPKKKTLLCQDQLITVHSRSQSAQTVNDATHAPQLGSTKSARRKTKTQQEQLQDRLARIAAKDKKDDDGLTLNDMEASKQALVTRNQSHHLDNRCSEPQFEQIAPLQLSDTESAELDQMIMPPACSPSPMATDSPRESRQLRRVVSEANAPQIVKPKRLPGAPVRYTPSPAKGPSAAPSVDLSESEASPVKQAPSLPPEMRQKKPLQKAVSLNTTSNGTSTVILSKPFQTPKPPVLKSSEPARDPNPWSREAFDLFTWRPPQWDEENWCLKVDSAG